LIKKKKDKTPHPYKTYIVVGGDSKTHSREEEKREEKRMKVTQVLVAHACNPSYLGG
jgi:hypothetical protein